MYSEAMVLAIGRAVERLIADSMFGVSMILGWNLFRAGILHDQTAEASGKGWKIRLQKVGPGVFFALFGAVGLIVALWRPLDIKFASPGASSPTDPKPATIVEIVSVAPNDSDVPEYVKALTTAESIGMRDNGTHSVEHDALQKAKPILEKHRQLLLRRYWGDTQYDWYLTVKSDPVKRQQLNATQASNFEKIDRSASDSFTADSN
jgi:hypothetical protein